MKRMMILLAINIWLGSLLFGQQTVALLEWPIHHPSRTTYAVGNGVKTAFELVRGMIYTGAEVDGIPGQFILDTGAPYLVLNHNPREARLQALSCKQDMNIQLTYVNQVQWAGRQQGRTEALFVDLSHFERAANRSIMGMIGYDQLRDQEIFIDYANRQLLLLPAEGNNLHRHGRPLASIPFVLYGHLPVIELRVGGQVLRLGIDTGAASNLLDERTLAKLDPGKLTFLRKEELQGLDKAVQTLEVYRIDDLRMQQEVVPQLDFLVGNLDHLRDATGLPIDGLVGYPFLSHYKFSLNYPQATLHLWGGIQP